MTRRIVTITRIKQLMHRMQHRRREVDRRRCTVDDSSPQAGVIAGVIASIVLLPWAKEKSAVRSLAGDDSWRESPSVALQRCLHWSNTGVDLLLSSDADCVWCPHRDLVGSELQLSTVTFQTDTEFSSPRYQAMICARFIHPRMLVTMLITSQVATIPCQPPTSSNQDL